MTCSPAWPNEMTIPVPRCFTVDGVHKDFRLPSKEMESLVQFSCLPDIGSHLCSMTRLNEDRGVIFVVR